MKDLVSLILAKLIWIFKSEYFWRYGHLYFFFELDSGIQVYILRKTFHLELFWLVLPILNPLPTKSMPQKVCQNAPLIIPNLMVCLTFHTKFFCVQENCKRTQTQSHQATTRKTHAQSNTKHTQNTRTKPILYTVYNATVPGAKSKLRKADYVKALENQFASNWGKYEDFFSKLEVDNATT